MQHFKKNLTLKDVQNYVVELEKERGFSKNTINKEILLGEEVGELFKALRKKVKIKDDHDSEFGSVDEELADIIVHLCAIANRFDIDLENAIRNKEEINKKRFQDKKRDEKRSH